MNRKTRQKKIWILTAAAVVILAVGTGGYFRYAKGPEKNGTGNTAEEGGQTSRAETTAERRAVTEEEKALIESQTGVTVAEDGTVQVDVGAIQEEEESMGVSREKAAELIISELGDGSEIESMNVREAQDKYYWAARAIQGDEARPVWIDAETGETFINQKE